MKKKIRGKTMMKKIWICVVLFLLAALLLSGCYVQSPSDGLPGRGNPSALPSSTVYFGAYNDAAIPWYVLDNSDGNLLLVSKGIIDTRAYHSADGATWSESDMRAWLNGDFYDAAFMDVEKSALMGSDKVTLLTLAQAQNPDYFGNDNVRIASNSTYWLTDDGGSAKCVTNTGAINSADATDTYGVRPVVCISGSAIAMLVEPENLDEGQIEEVRTPNYDRLRLALWDDTLPSLSVSGYAVDDDSSLTVDCTPSSALAADEKVYAYFAGRTGVSDYMGWSSLSNGQLTYNNDMLEKPYDVQLAVVKPSSTASYTWAVGPVSTEFGPVHRLNIYGIEEGGSYLTGESLEFTAVGENAINSNTIFSRDRPSSWTVDSQSGTWSDAPYTGSLVFNTPGDYTLTVTFSYEQSSGDDWTEYGTTTRTVSFHVVEPIITASPADGIIRVGESITLTPNIAGGTWDFDSDYLSRSGNVFTGLKEGTTTVKYTTVDGKYDAVTVTVVKVDVTGVTLSSKSETLKKGETTTLTATVSPSGATYPDVTWKSSDESIATVDASGKVTAKSFGCAAITAEAEGKFAICIINVVKTDVTGVSLSSSSKTLKKDETVTLGATVSPSGATYSDVTWKSSDTDVVTVDANGKVTAKDFGIATITAEADGVTAVCTIAVVKTDVTSVALSSASETLKKDDTLTIGATVSPSGATYPDVTWKSSDTDIVTVDSTGKVTAKDFGFATITAEADGVTAVCTIAVVKTDVTGVSLSRTYKEMGVGDKVTLDATVTPGDSTYPDVTWTSTNTSVATVSQSGKVTARSEGAAAIVADADGKYAVCTILVSSEPDISDDGSEEDDENEVTPTATPAATPTVSPSGETGEVPDTGDESPEDTPVPQKVIITIVVSDLPEGTASVKLPGGEVVEIDGLDTIQLEVDDEDINEDGTLELTALDDEGTPLGLYEAGRQEITIPDSGAAWDKIGPVLMWILIGIGVLGAAGAAVYLIMRKRNRV